MKKELTYTPLMDSENLAAQVQHFVHTSLNALVRAEVAGRVPSRFTGDGPQVWQIFRNELTLSDLVALVIEDAGVAMPVPFNPALWWPEWPDWALRELPLVSVETWLDEALATAEQPQVAFLQDQARILELALMDDETVAPLSTPAAHEHWLELPGTAGWVAYSLCQRPDADLYFWENFTIVCATPQEMMFAGLVAWELNAPPRQPLPIHLDPDLVDTLRSDQTFHQIIARQDMHGHRALNFLQNDNQPPFWL